VTEEDMAVIFLNTKWYQCCHQCF